MQAAAGATSAELIAQIRRIGAEVAGPAASSVDRDARFPVETIGALKEVGALSAAVPRELGGAGATVPELYRMCEALAQHCASSAMVLSMHHIQVASIARHAGKSPYFAEYLKKCVEEQRLIASCTSEVGPSGDMRSSVCSVNTSGDRFEVAKHATTMSYVEAADDVLLSARRNAEAAPSDQVLVLAVKGGYELDEIGVWDTLGMRGTCSPGGWIRVAGSVDQIVPQDFADIATMTMVPYSHLLWGGVWAGIAGDAVAKARALVRAKARKQPGAVPPAAQRLSELNVQLQVMRSSLEAICDEYNRMVLEDDVESLSSVGFALKLNNAKLAASEAVADIVTGALRVCGIMAYKNDSPYSLGRHLRDAHSAALMISNERIHATNASLLLVHKGD